MKSIYKVYCLGDLFMSQSHFKVSRPKTELMEFLFCCLHLLFWCVYIWVHFMLCVWERVEGRGGVASWQESALSCHEGLREANPDNQAWHFSQHLGFLLYQGSPGLRVIQVVFLFCVINTSWLCPLPAPLWPCWPSGLWWFALESCPSPCFPFQVCCLSTFHSLSTLSRVGHPKAFRAVSSV